jgi:hypothetical protein
LTDAGLAHLRQLVGLEELILWDCKKVTDKGVPHLKALQSLQKVDLRGTKVSRAGVAEIEKALPRCVVFK